MCIFASQNCGRVAERLGRGLQNLVRRFESAPDLNIPGKVWTESRADVVRLFFALKEMNWLRRRCCKGLSLPICTTKLYFAWLFIFLLAFGYQMPSV